MGHIDNLTIKFHADEVLFDDASITANFILLKISSHLTYGETYIKPLSCFIDMICG